MRMPESLRMATLLPDAAMRPRRLAEPFSCVPIEENVSFCLISNNDGLVGYQRCFDLEPGREEL